eukprot:8051164-Prorocentrum_lima.AAC.1
MVIPARCKPAILGCEWFRSSHAFGRSVPGGMRWDRLGREDGRLRKHAIGMVVRWFICTHPMGG